MASQGKMISGKHLALVLRKRAPVSQEAWLPPALPSCTLVFCFTLLWGRRVDNAPFLLREALVIPRNREQSPGIWKPQEPPGQSDPPVYAGTHDSAESGIYPCWEQSPSPSGVSSSHPFQFWKEGRKESRRLTQQCWCLCCYACVYALSCQ